MLEEEVKAPHNFPLLVQDELLRVAGVERLVTELAEPGRYLLGTPGKQLRSAVTLHAAKAGAHPDAPEVRTAAIAVELFQIATLAHDDLIDDGEIRRGADSVGMMYGSLASGFAGGMLVARSLELMAECGGEAARMFTRAAAVMCAGQMREFEDIYDTKRSLERYHEAITGKTASLFELSAWLGIHLADAPEEIISSIARFGHNFGLAFQIADDILDIVADESETGKPAAKDLCQGVYNLPVIYAIAENADLRKALSRPFDRVEVGDLVAMIKRTSGIDLAMRDCLAYFEQARTELSSMRDMMVGGIDDLMRLLDQAIAPVASRGQNIG